MKAKKFGFEIPNLDQIVIAQVLSLEIVYISSQEIGNDSSNIGNSMERLSLLKGEGGTKTNRIDAQLEKQWGKQVMKTLKW